MMEDKLEKIFRKGRWYIRGNEKGIMPFANYTWVRGNPAFQSIPKGYVIHHLDGDQVNDDISNLVIMQKHHHLAYHLKCKTIKPEIKLNKRLLIKDECYSPTKEPRINEYRSGSFKVRFGEIIHGLYERTDVCSWNGSPFKSREMAEKFKATIWPRREILGSSGGVEKV